MKISIKAMSIAALLSATLSATPLLAAENFAAQTSAQENNENEGKALFESQCMACHQPRHEGEGVHGKGSKGRLAPPMPMVKKHYLEAYPERQAFIDKVSAWVNAPDANKAILDRAVEKLGLMPTLVVDEASRQKIAAYIYDELPVGRCPGHGGVKHGGKHSNKP